MGDTIGPLLFWLAAVALTAGTLALATRPLWRRRDPAASRAAHDVAVFKSQIAEIDRDVGRGALTAAEGEAARREIARRLLAADTEAEAAPSLAVAPPEQARAALIACAALLLLVGGGVYMAVGDPGRPDLPLAERDIAAEKRALQFTQAEAEQTAPADRAADDPPAGVPEGFPDMVARMETIVAERPEDVQGRLILGQAYMRLERPRAAYSHLERAAELLGAAAPTELFVDIGRARAAAAGGYVTQEAEAAFRRAPGAPLSQLFIGQAEANRGDLRDALARWAALYQTMPDGPMTEALLDQIRIVAEAQNLDPAIVANELETRRTAALAALGPPAGMAGAAVSGGAPGPTAEDVEAAREQTPEERMEMISGMVDGLRTRLEAEPEDLQGWLRLLRSYQVLGREEDGRAALATALAAFEDAPEARGALIDAAPSTWAPTPAVTPAPTER